MLMKNTKERKEKENVWLNTGIILQQITPVWTKSHLRPHLVNVKMFSLVSSVFLIQ